MSREITYEPILRITPDGRRTLLVLPTIPDQAPTPIREAIARRRLAALTGRCPCGATCNLTRQQRRARQRRATKRADSRVAIEHESDCPATDTNLLPLVEEWIAGDTQRGCA